MATFEETVLALNPVLFWRCKDLLGTQITDYSGNDFHGTITIFNNILGQPSAVETDPDARSVYSSGTSIFFANNIAEIDEPPPELLFTGDFTILCFIKHQSQSGFQYLFGRGGQAGSTTQGIHFATTGLSTRTLFVWFRTDDGLGNFPLLQLSAETSHLNDTDYLFGVTRIGAGVRLWRNDELVGEDASADTNPLRIGSSNRLVFGAAANNLGPMKGWGAELIICDYGLTQAEIIAVYESAINATFLSGVSNVIPTAILDGSDDPDPISFPFRHNWTSDLIERVSFRTASSKAKRGAEETVKTRPKPRRTIEINQMLRTNNERQSFRAKLWANQSAKWFIPILEDRDSLTDSLPAGSTVIPVATQYKDYENGSWISLRQLNAQGEVIQSEDLQIALVNSADVFLMGATANAYSGQVEVCPARRGYIDASTIRGHTDAIEDLTITAHLLAEDEQAIPHRIEPWTATITYKGYEVFDPAEWQSNDWSELREYEVDREFEDIDFDAGVFSRESDTPAAQEVFTYRAWIKGREANARFLGWFYDKAGAAKNLWVPSMQRDFNFVSSSLFDVTVEGHTYTQNYAGIGMRRDLAFIYRDNSMNVRRINSSVASGANDLLTLDAVTPSQANLRSISLLKFCRLDSDQLEIAKRTDDIWIYAWRFRELLTSPD